MLENPDRLRLGGERREISWFFSDLAGFSTISEQLDPERLVALLNEYLSEMSGIIKEAGGTLDKFEGDAILAFWGAPVSRDDHALRACGAALDNLRGLDRLNPGLVARGLPALNVRIGLNSGPAVVGNMGAVDRFDYTMMGDTVNLGARLEGANKFFGTRILISQAICRMAGEGILTRPLGPIRVVGRREAIEVYELLARTEEGTERLSTLVRTYTEALAHYRERRFVEALERLAPLGQDPPSAGLARRCRALLDTPPPADWDGVIALSSK